MRGVCPHAGYLRPGVEQLWGFERGAARDCIVYAGYNNSLVRVMSREVMTSHLSTDIVGGLNGSET